MATSSTSYSGGLLTTNYDNSNLFLANNRFQTATYTNGTGSSVTLAEGTLMGRVFSNNKVLPQVSTAVDGSQMPIGVLKGSYTVANGASVTVTFCYSGDVTSDMLTLGGSDTLATVIVMPDNAGTPNTTKMATIGDALRWHGINPISRSENTLYDN